MYRGEWQHNYMHGCGVKIWRTPAGDYAAQEGKFFADDYVGPIMSCDVEAARRWDHWQRFTA